MSIFGNIALSYEQTIRTCNACMYPLHTLLMYYIPSQPNYFIFCSFSLSLFFISLSLSFPFLFKCFWQPLLLPLKQALFLIPHSAFFLSGEGFFRKQISVCFRSLSHRRYIPRIYPLLFQLMLAPKIISITPIPSFFCLLERRALFQSKNKVVR